MEVKIKAPSSLREITLRQYQEFLKIEEPQSKDVLNVFLRLSNSVIDKIPHAEVERVSGLIMSMFPKDGKCAFVQRFELNDREYGFIPDLDKISFGENADVTHFISDWQEVHKAMSVLYRPINFRKGNQYRITEYEGVNNSMAFMPLDVCLGAMGFFLTLLNDLLPCIPDFISRELEKLPQREKPSLQNGESITKFTHSPREMLDELKILLNSPFISV